MPDYEFENALREKGYKSICGVDEAGRGPLAGNVVAGAVIIPEGLIIEGLDDSKKLSEKKRERLYDIITERLYGRLRGRALRRLTNTIFSARQCLR